MCSVLRTASNLIAERPILVEAPSGFSTPTLVEGVNAKSTSNGIPEPPGDSFAMDQGHFEESESEATGLGPVYNAPSCVTCHQNPVTGGSSQVTELRAGHTDSSGAFANPTISINHGQTAISGRSLINDRAICPEAQEHVPQSETIRSLRIASSVLGDGFVEAVADDTLIALAQKEAEQSGGTIAGEYVMVPVLEAPGTNRIGRFGWKDQHASLLSFSSEAYLDELGITNRLSPTDTTTICNPGKGLEDIPDDIGMADIDHFTQFVRGTKAPPRDLSLIPLGQTVAGVALFRNIGCEICHTPTLATVAPGTVLNGGTYVVSEAIGNKLIHPYSDFLLHDVGTGDGIVQNGPASTANKIRTAPLWGLRVRNRYLHDGRALTLDDAIREHSGESAQVIQRYKDLNLQEREKLRDFLSSL
jgi:CxxC motif-containing protein (DUF1111 family)